MKIKKIFFIIDSLSGGGAERVLSELANYYSDVEKKEVYIITLLNKRNFYHISDNIRLLEYDSQNEHNVFQRYRNRICFIKKMIKQYNPDIGISFLPMSNMISCMAFSKLKVPLIISERNDPNNNPASKYKRMIRDQLYKLADGFVFQTTDAKKYFSDKIQRKAVVIANPLKSGLSEYKTNLSDDNNIIFTVGRLEQQKNHSMLILAFMEVIKKYPNYKLWIYGEGSKKDQLKNMVSELGIERSVVFKGVSSEWYNEVQKADIFVLTSDYEGMPNALLEAMALGKICVSTDCPIGGPKELIQSGNNGYLIPVGNVEELSKKLMDIIENKSSLNQISKSAYNSAQKNQLPVIIEYWTSFFEKVIAYDYHQSKKV